jgi:hypothetical protein
VIRICATRSAGSDDDHWVKKIFQSDIAIHLAPHAIGDAIDDLRAVPRRIYMDPERALAERKIDDPYDLPGDFRGIGIDGLETG